jgi:hypothetical protein
MGLEPGLVFHPPVQCLPGGFPGQGTAVGATILGDPVDAGEFRLAVLDERGKLVAMHDLSDYSDPTGVYVGHSLEMLGDLDADGVDELLVRRRSYTPGPSSESLVVLRIRGKKLHAVLERPLDSFVNVNWRPRGEHDMAPRKPEDSLVCKASVMIGQDEAGQPELWIDRRLERGERVPPGKSLGDRCPAGRERLRMTADGVLLPVSGPGR